MDVATPRLRILYVLWLVVVCASTVLTHRHHLLDVAGGIAITLAARRLRRAAAPSTQSSCLGAAHEIDRLGCRPDPAHHHSRDRARRAAGG
jgi:membrane-associated phospholipid phosphatase